MISNYGASYGNLQQAALAESGAALAGQQRVAEERGKKLNAVENRAVLLEAEAAQLRSELEEQSIMRCAACLAYVYIQKAGHHMAAIISAPHRSGDRRGCTVSY